MGEGKSDFDLSIANLVTLTLLMAFPPRTMFGELEQRVCKLPQS